jgi:protein arginine phosphatase
MHSDNKGGTASSPFSRSYLEAAGIEAQGVSMKLLIVCAGNTCRSPMAGGLLKKIASERGIDLEIHTAGLAHHPNQPVAEQAVAALQEFGINISDEYSKPVTADALTWADIIVAVQQSHKEYLLAKYPEVAGKVHCLACDVRDPYGGSISDYRAVRDKLEQLLSGFVLTLWPA